MDLDEFSDDGFDDLNETVLQELENQAISFTQAQAKHQNNDQSRYEECTWEEDDDLDTSEVINGQGVSVGRPSVERNQPPQQPPVPPPQPQLHRPIPPPPNPRWNPVVDLTKRQNAGIPTRQQFPQTGGPGRGGFAGSQSSILAARPQSSQFARPTLPNRFAPSQGLASQSSQNAQDRPNDITSALQQRVRALEAELNAARGEISIVRSKAEKQAQDHDAQLSRLRRVNSDALAHQARVAEAAVAAEKTASTELQFMQQDMREVNTRQRRKHGDNDGRGGSFTTTPKKSKGWADGFDEMEIAHSPSKGQGRGRAGGSVAANVGERTPSKNKRKRPNFDSPVKPLDIHTGDVVMLDKPETVPSQAAQPSATNSTVSVANPAPPFEFLQLVLDHATFCQQPPTFDVLSRVAFPSQPNVSFATLIFQRLPVLGSPHKPILLLVDFVELMISLWAKCLDEAFLEPLKYLVALISFTFQLHTTTVAPLVVTSLASVVQPTTWKVIDARQRLPDGDLSKSDEYASLEKHIDASEILALLHTSALSCVTSFLETDDGELEHTIGHFWRIITLDFVMLCLTPKQKPSEVVRMLDLLATSSLPETLGPITEDVEPAVVARYVIDRVSAKLTETPRYAATSATDRRAMRISALRTLISFARHGFGAAQLAAHDNVIPRLVACLSGALDDLYDQPIPPGILPQPDYEAPHEPPAPSVIVQRIICQCVVLLHTLVTVHGADVGAKLAVSHGGSQRYLISLGRLTFAEEDLVMEAGIESEVAEMAHELLEMAVTPDEGEAVSEVFGA